MNINILIGGQRFEELTLNRQIEIREKITDIQRNIVKERVARMIRDGEPDKEIRNYLGWNDMSNY